MISTDDFRMLVQQFKNYTGSLMIPDQYMQDHIDLKVRHTYDVIGNIRIIAKDSGLPENDIQLAKIIALVHDIGRFQQFLLTEPSMTACRLTMPSWESGYWKN